MRHAAEAFWCRAMYLEYSFLHLSRAALISLLRDFALAMALLATDSPPSLSLVKGSSTSLCRLEANSENCTLSLATSPFKLARASNARGSAVASSRCRVVRVSFTRPRE
jgi:hypothetical protein